MKIIEMPSQTPYSTLVFETIYSQRASRMNTQLQQIHKIFHSLIWFFNYEMILRTFNCTIANQIKSSKKLVVKLKIRNLQLLQMKTILKLFFGRVPLFSRGNKWVTVSLPRCVFKRCTRSLVVSCIKTQVYCVLELTNIILCRSLPLLCTFEDAVFLLG